MTTHRFAFQNKIDQLCRWGAWLAAIGLMGLAILVSYEVIARYVWGHSGSWIAELSVYLMMAIGFLAAAYALQQNSHFAITFFVERLTPAGQRKLALLTDAMGLFYCLVFVVKGVDMVWFSHHIGDTSTGLMQMPLWIPSTMIPIGGLLLALQFLNRLIDGWYKEAHA